ncbi:MAG: SDR family NAD(P)-dependent oxidoreductase [Nioella sp.]
MLEPQGRVIMVSGASRGIGRALVERLIERGYSVSAGIRDPGALDDMTTPHLLTARFDATDRASHQGWLDATLDRFGRLDGLVNNAGIADRFTIDHGDEADLDALLAVNVKGPLFLTRACLPHLRASGTGRIVNVASL